ncbi:MAG: cytochrome c oxidase subunit II [Proteobacteria bacterium]|jgi:cytochrome c oxidase subunit II|nr:cytochrome c oxidase subunit II [Pseudomonadota bacterium]MDA0942011.1 cytochrome c oxidase subunit II [Pseudomonadota bacterium]MDA1034117.1 cytochrome c oxidase subunit II [Pseudomonadota bacterium]
MTSIFKKLIQVIFLLTLPLGVIAEWGLNMGSGVTPISQKVYDMHMISLTVVTVIGILVFGVMFWSIFHHRKSRGVKPAQFSHSTTVEVIWTTIPLIIIIGLAIPATKLLIEMDDTSDSALTVKAVGYQWKWKYEYLEDDLTIYSNLDEKSVELSQRVDGVNPMEHENYLLDVDEPLVLPTNTKIRILTTANDVIHAWWVPDLGWKRDAIPGFINDNWTMINEPGTYRGQCTEICGKGHGYMPIVVKAVSMEEYKTWVAEKKESQEATAAASNKEMSMEELMTKGEVVYKANCLACHQANGQGIQGVFPALAGSQIAIKPENIKTHITHILYGKNLMPAFGEQLNDGDIAAVTTYERNAWGNDTGDMIQASDIKAERK